MIRPRNPAATFVTDAAYLAAAVASSPVWLVRMGRTGKLRTDWPGRMGAAAPWPRPEQGGAGRILIHAVSVGEVNAVRPLVEALQAGGAEVAVSATTDTGFARAREAFEGRARVVRWPFDFSWGVRRFLDAVRPDVLVTAELEVWPSMVAACAARGIPVAVVNGRLSDRSISRYRWAKPVLRGTFRRLSLVLAQTDTYAARFRELGVPSERVERSGTMKWDTAVIADAVPGADRLAGDLGIDRRKPLVVAGSTAPGEEALLRDSLPPEVQLLCAPRKPEWFDAAAADLPGCVRRSRGGRGSATGRFLLDTIGELRAAYSLADVVVVGRTFELPRPLHGSDMMEPVGLGKAVIVGPDVANFRETAECLLTGGGLVQCAAADLPSVLRRLLADPQERRRLAEAGRAVIRREQGATARTASRLLGLLAAARGGAGSR